MTKWIKTIKGIVDTIALERPGHFETETYQEEVSRQVPVLDAEGNPTVDENGQPVMEPVTVMEDRHRQIFVADEAFVEGPDDVFAGFLFDGEKYSAPKPPAPTSDQVNTERDRRVSLGFNFIGKLYDFDMKAKTNISGAAQMAFMAIVQGAKPGNSTWHGGTIPFAWIAADNSLTLMDAHTVVAFGQAAAKHEQKLIFKARELKDLPVIPDDYLDDKYWV